MMDPGNTQMFTEETREKLLKEIVRQEVREQEGVELEDLLNPIKVFELFSILIISIFAA